MILSNKYKRKERNELAGYLLDQIEARQKNDIKKFLAASCAVVSFKAEHGEKKVLAITADLDKELAETGKVTVK